MTELPLWAVYAVAFGTPASALAGVLISQWLSRRTARELEVRSRREELMRNLRWAAELSVSSDEGRSELGIAQLAALGDSELFEAADQVFIDAALASVIKEPAEEIDEIEAAGDLAEVVEDDEGEDVDPAATADAVVHFRDDRGSAERKP